MTVNIRLYTVNIYTLINVKNKNITRSRLPYTRYIQYCRLPITVVCFKLSRYLTSHILLTNTLYFINLLE